MLAALEVEEVVVVSIIDFEKLGERGFAVSLLKNEVSIAVGIALYLLAWSTQARVLTMGIHTF